MKQLTLIFLLFISIPLSILSQVKVEIVKSRDSMYLAVFNYADGEHSLSTIITKDSIEVDSLKKGLCLFNILEKEKNRKTQRDNTIKALVGTLIPDFEAPDTLGFIHRPSHYHGRVLILHFWNFWDYSFENEMPILNKMIDSHRKEGLEILSFTDIKLGESEKNKLKKTPIDFPLIPNAWQFSDKFLSLNKSKPYLVVVDKRGQFRHFFINRELNFLKDKEGEKKFATQIEDTILSLLKE
jgi:hypothetical protein